MCANPHPRLWFPCNRVACVVLSRAWSHLDSRSSSANRCDDRLCAKQSAAAATILTDYFVTQRQTDTSQSCLLDGPAAPRQSAPNKHWVSFEVCPVQKPFFRFQVPSSFPASLSPLRLHCTALAHLRHRISQPLCPRLHAERPFCSAETRFPSACSKALRAS